MKNEQKIREILIKNTTRVISEGGFESATTRAIVFSGETLPNVKMNEAYIYRLFGSKEKLYEAAFLCLEQEFAFALKRYLDGFATSEHDIGEKMKNLFLDVWRYILDNESHFRYCSRFYYSVYFEGALIETHDQIFEGIISAFAPLFRDDADVGAIMHSLYAAMLGLAVRVYNGDMPDTREIACRIYSILYGMVQSSLKNEQG